MLQIRPDSQLAWGAALPKLVSLISGGPWASPFLAERKEVCISLVYVLFSSWVVAMRWDHCPLPVGEGLDGYSKERPDGRLEGTARSLAHQFSGNLFSFTRSGPPSNGGLLLS